MTKEELELDERVKAERKRRIVKNRKRRNLDNKHADAIKLMGIAKYPIDLPSLDKVMWGDSKRVDWLSDGFMWIDKPHKAMDKAMQEIRALREYIVNQDEAFKNYRK